MNTLLENIRASAILMKNLPSTLSGDALLISREEARRIGYELEACAERMEQKVPPESQDGYAEGWTAERRAMLRGAVEAKVPQGVEEWIAEHGLQFVDTIGGYGVKLKRSSELKYPCPEYVAIDDLMNLLSGMAIVPVELLRKAMSEDLSIPGLYDEMRAIIEDKP